MENPNPCFFQLYLEEKCSLTMRIPPPFIKNFKGGVPGNMTLKSLSGETWPVKLSHVGSRLHITRGWECYARENSLKTGDFVVFQYLNNTEFLVTAFGPNGCLKTEPVEVNQVEKSRGRSSRRGLARALTFQRTHLDKNFVCLPKSIISQHSIRLPQNINLRSKDYCIKVQLKRTTDRVIMGYGGMKSFWQMIDVNVGDTLEFKVILGHEECTIEEIFVTNLSLPTRVTLRRGVYDE